MILQILQGITVTIRENKPVAFTPQAISRYRRENHVAAQPMSMPNELPAKIKALIDTVLGGFNSKNSAQYNGAFSEDAVVIDV